MANFDLDDEFKEKKQKRLDNKIAKLPFIRGVFAFVDSLILGMKVTMHSASFYEDEEEENITKIDIRNSLDKLEETERKIMVLRYVLYPKPICQKLPSCQI